MSLDGASHGVPLPDVDPRLVRYLGLFPNLLVSLHPDYVMTHRLEPLAPDRTRVECEWLFPAEVTDPAYAVDFWDVTNRQDWAACESVQRGVSSPHFVPGPLAPERERGLRLGDDARARLRRPVDRPRRAHVAPPSHVTSSTGPARALATAVRCNGDTTTSTVTTRSSPSTMHAVSRPPLAATS